MEKAQGEVHLFWGGECVFVSVCMSVCVCELVRSLVLESWRDYLFCEKKKM